MWKRFGCQKSIRFSFSMYHIHRNGILNVFFFRISNCILCFFLSLNLLSVFFCGLSFLYSFQTINRKERESINRLHRLDISKMMSNNVFIHYLFILLLSLVSVHVTVSQSSISTDALTSMLLTFFSYLLNFLSRIKMCVNDF